MGGPVSAIPLDLLNSAPATSWTGIYGGLFGNTVATAGTTTTTTNFFGLGTVTNPFSAHGQALGARAGAMYQLPQSPVVLGLEIYASHQFTGTKDALDLANSNNNSFGISGRLGYAIGQSLLYGSFGRVWRRIDYFFPPYVLQPLNSTSKTFDGVSFGGGIEYRLSSLWSVTAGYVQTRFSYDKEFDYIFGSQVVSTSSVNHVFRIGFNFHLVPP